MEQLSPDCRSRFLTSSHRLRRPRGEKIAREARGGGRLRLALPDGGGGQSPQLFDQETSCGSLEVAAGAAAAEAAAAAGEAAAAIPATETAAPPKPLSRRPLKADPSNIPANRPPPPPPRPPRPRPANSMIRNRINMTPPPPSPQREPRPEYAGRVSPPAWASTPVTGCPVSA